MKFAGGGLVTVSEAADALLRGADEGIVNLAADRIEDALVGLDQGDKLMALLLCLTARVMTYPDPDALAAVVVDIFSRLLEVGKRDIDRCD